MVGELHFHLYVCNCLYICWCYHNVSAVLPSGPHKVSVDAGNLKGNWNWTLYLIYRGKSIVYLAGQCWLGLSENWVKTGIIRHILRYGQQEGNSLTPVKEIKSSIWNYLKFSQMDKHRMKARGHNDRSIVIVKTKMRAIISIENAENNTSQPRSSDWLKLCIKTKNCNG